MLLSLLGVRLCWIRLLESRRGRRRAPATPSSVGAQQARWAQTRIQHRSFAKRAGSSPSMMLSLVWIRLIAIHPRALGELRKIGYDCAALLEALQHVQSFLHCRLVPCQAGFTAADLMDVCTVCSSESFGSLPSVSWSPAASHWIRLESCCWAACPCTGTQNWKLITRAQNSEGARA